MYGKRNHFAAEYATRIEWLVQEMDMSLNDCLVCRNDNGPYVVGIR